MSVIDIDIAMLHLRAEPVDQPLVQRYLDAAEDAAMQYLQRRFFASTSDLEQAVLAGDAGHDPLLITPSILAACLLILGHFYDSRIDLFSETGRTDLPTGSRSLLAPFRRNLGV
ncbi:head-tail connector protein [Pseudomonas poae]|nr:head-tail connector protein [Pseudomonas poae]